MADLIELENLGPAPMTRHPYAITLGVVVALAVVGVLVYLLLKALGVVDGFESFRAWNACPMHDIGTPYPRNACNRHSMTVDGTPASLGETYGVKLLDNKKTGCSCSCTCPRKQGQTSSITQASQSMLENSTKAELPSLNDLQSYAKNMWNSVVKDGESPTANIKSASEMKNSGGNLMY